MGWNPFKSKKKTSVATQVMRAIEDEVLPNSIKQGSVRAFFEEGNISEYLLEESIQSLANKAERMYQYAEKSYAFGLPSGEVYSASQGRQEVEAILEAQEGTQITLEYSRFGPPNALHLAWMKLVAEHSYNPQANTLTVAGVGQVYLDDLVVVVPKATRDSYELGALNQWGTPAAGGYTPERPAFAEGLGNLVAHTPVLYSDTATQAHVLVKYVWKDALGVMQRSSFTLSHADYPDDLDLFHAKYTVGTQVKYWAYQARSGVYSTLDALFDSAVVENGSYFPVAYFRHNKQRVDLNKDSAEYKTTAKMLKYIGIEYQAMIDAIHENPDIQDVEQAMLFMAVPANTENEIEQKYLFDFFEAQFYALDYIPYDAKYSGFLGLITKGDPYACVIQDKRSQFSLNHRGITKKVLVGKLGAIGAHVSEFKKIPVSMGATEVDANNNWISVVLGNTVPCHYYRKQITDTMYEEIQVIDLQLKYNILGEFNVFGDGTEDILMVPIDRTITKNYWVGDKEVLYARSLHYVFNSLVITQVKWYQQGWFMDLLKIAAIVWTIYTLGTDGGAAYAAAITAGYTAVQALVIAIVVTVGTSLLIRAAIKLFVKTVGQDLAFLALVVAAAYGVNGIVEAGGFKAAAPFAKDMLMMANGLMSGITADIQDQMKDLLGDFGEFQKSVDDQLKTLDSAKDLLKTATTLSPFTLFGESPENYYKRTVHSGNIGTITVDAVGNYVERSLTLPQLSETLGEY